MSSLAHLFGEPELRERQVDWRPEAPPQLDGIDEIELDFETDGLEWWNGAKPIGVALRRPNGVRKYYPWGHLGGGNLDEGVMKRWFQREVRGKKITNSGIRFDNHIALNWDLSFEDQGNILSDVQHYAALLDDYRRRFALEILSHDMLGPEHGKLKLTSGGQVLDATRMKEYHAGEVAAYAEQDVHLVGELKKVMLPQLQAQNLMRVSALEDEVIYAACEMERNGIRLDMEKLDRWIKESEQAYLKIIYFLYRETGLRVNPDSSDDMQKLFKHLKLPITERTAKGRASFTDALLRKIDHPLVVMARKAGKLQDLRSKYLLKYRRCVNSDGILRYALHQLRADEGGTNRGRFASSGLATDVGINSQQILALEKQIDSYGEDFIVRELLVAGQTQAEADAGVQMYSADAMQIEYRVFAHHANNPKVIQKYKDDPLASFHVMTWDYAKEIKPDILYKPMKNMNFAKVFGAKLLKIAIMLGDITQAEADEIKLKHGWKYRDHPALQNARRMDTIYREVLPEVDPLLKKASDLAANRGYVHTALGRRARFPFKERLHAALNAVIQGTAADINKLKVVALHKARKSLDYVPRLTVHDQVVGDSRDPSKVAKITELLNEQAIPLRVPILWSASTGNNLRECDEAAA